MSRWDDFWESLAPTPERFTVFRFAFFSVIAVDAWKRIGPAARPGVCHFNVSHIPALDPYLPVPTDGAMRLLLVCQVFLAVMAAIGAATRRTLVLLTALYGASYFISISDSYAHHYLGFLLLLLFCVLKWDHAPPTPWVLRLILVQYSVVYFWAAVGKITPAWVTGEVLLGQVNPEWLKGGVFAVTQALHLDLLGTWGLFAKAVVVGELLLPLALHWERGRPLVCAVGFAMHGSIEFLELEIGRFSYFMMAIYVFLLPDAVHAAVMRAVRRLAEVTGVSRVPARLWWGAGVLALLATAWVPLPAIGTLVAALAGLAVVGSGKPLFDGPRAASLLAGCATVCVLAAGTSVVQSHLEIVAAASLSCGAKDLAEERVDQLLATEPTHVNGLIIRGDLYRARGQVSRARTYYQRALARQPNHPVAIERNRTVDHQTHLPRDATPAPSTP